MQNIVNHGPRFAPLLLILPALVFVLSLLWSIVPAPAQVVGYYIGPPWDISACESLFHTTAPPCINGSVVGSVTFAGVSSTFTGSVTGSQVTSYTLSATGVPSISSLSDLNVGGSTFGITNGQVTSAAWQAYHFSGVADWGITVYQGPGPNDEAYYRDLITPQFLAAGFVDPAYGTWVNPKSFGIACARPGAPTCGEPIDLGSGNVFDQIADYETAGANKLSLIRYYNSFAMPDTYATSMGSNWRTNYDRYLHIINPSAIYGVEAERPDGAVITFTSNSGTYTPDSDVDLNADRFRQHMDLDRS